MNQPIRILNLFTVMDRGGAETMVMNYYRAIDKSKVQFDFMVHREERGAYDDEIEAMGGHIYRMCPIYPQNIGKYKKQLKEFFDLHTEYQILHSHMSELGTFAFEEAIRHHVPVRICHAHNAPVFSSETPIEKLKRIPREIMARKMRSLATDFFCCSQVAGDWLFGKHNRDKMIFMRNAIDAANFAYSPEKSQQAKVNFNWQDKIVIGHVGRFNPQKNHDFLIDIFYTFHQQHPNSILVLVGNGELQEKIKNKAKALNLSDSVIFMGVRSDMNQIYWAFDLFLFPSFYEGLPVTLVEAQSAGLPCVISDTISEQTKITSKFYPVSIEQNTEIWAKQIEEALQEERINTFEQVKQKGFDIHANAEWLTSYYSNKCK